LGGGYQPGATALAGAGVCSAGVADSVEVVSSDQALAGRLPISAVAARATKDANLFMTHSVFVLLVSVPVDFTQINRTGLP
jgi:hypothetical protein